jgi:hypothetical protein
MVIAATRGAAILKQQEVILPVVKQEVPVAHGCRKQNQNRWENEENKIYDYLKVCLVPYLWLGFPEMTDE